MAEASVPVKSLGLEGGIGASMTCAGGPTAVVRLDETSVVGGKASGALTLLAWAMTSKSIGRLGGRGGGVEASPEGFDEMAEIVPSTKLSSSGDEDGVGSVVEGAFAVCANRAGTEAPLGECAIIVDEGATVVGRATKEGNAPLKPSRDGRITSGGALFGAEIFTAVAGFLTGVTADFWGASPDLLERKARMPMAHASEMRAAPAISRCVLSNFILIFQSFPVKFRDEWMDW